MSEPTKTQRELLFQRAKAISPALGDIFQNPEVITMEDLNREIERARAEKRREGQRFEKYIWTLGHMLCFPEMPLNLEEGE